MERKVGDFKMKVDRYWVDDITKGVVSYWGSSIHLLTKNVSGKHLNEEIIDDSRVTNNHSNFRCESNADEYALDGILIRNTSKDMLTTCSVLNKFVKQVLPIIEYENRNQTPY